MASTESLKTLISFEKLLFLLVLTPFIYIGANVFLNGVPDLPNAGDAALLELSTRNVFSSGILVGPYSRFIFFHPGPLYYQLRYPLYMIMGQRNSSLLIVTVLLQMLCLFFAWKTIREISDRNLSIVFSVSAALYLLAADKALWLSEWNPYIVILPFMLFTISMAAVASGRFKYLVTAVAAGSLAAQTHISVIPSMAVVSVFTILFAVYPWFVSNRRSNKFEGRWILVSIGLFLLLWAAPLYQQFFPGDGQGNMTRIVHYFQESSPEVDSRRAFIMWSSIITTMELGGRESSDALRISVISLRLILLLVSFRFLRRRGDRPFLSSMALFCAALHGMSWISVMQIRGELNDYLLQWIGVLPVMSLFVILGTIQLLLKPNRMKFAGAAAVIMLVYSAVALPLKVSDFYRAELHPSWENEITTDELAKQLEENLNWNDNTFYVISLVTTDQWPIMFGLLNSMEKNGRPVGVEDNLLYVHTPAPEGMTTRILHLGVLNEQGYVMPGLAAEYNGTGLILQ